MIFDLQGGPRHEQIDSLDGLIFHVARLCCTACLKKESVYG
jgi:hypothetical protein